MKSSFQHFSPVVIFILILMFTFCSRSPETMLPGKLPDGLVLLPNRYRLSPAGDQIPVGDLPLNMVISPDSKYLAITNNGYSEQFVSIIDVAHKRQVQTLSVRASFFGIDFSDDGSKLFVSGGGKNLIYLFANQNSQFVRADSILLKTIAVGDHPNKISLVGDGRLFLANANTDNVTVIDAENDSVIETISVKPYPDAPNGSTPNGLAVAANNKTLYVANADNNNVTVVDISQPGASRTTGWYPTAVAITKTGDQLFIANDKGF
jgi:YVTN family beta-propeller protein